MVSGGAMGRWSSTRNPSPSGPAVSSPPSKDARSSRPSRPLPPLGSSSAGGPEAGPLVTVRSTVSGPHLNSIPTSAPGAYLAALVSDS